MRRVEKELGKLRPNEAEATDHLLIPLRYPYIDQPSSFVNYNRTDNTLGTALTKLNHAYISFFSTQGTFCYVPDTAAFDARFKLMLFTEFGRPVFTPPDNELQGVAISSFNVGQLLDSSTGDPLKGAVFDIAQYQTLLFDNTSDMFHYVGFMKYKELFTHIIEQIAYRLSVTRRFKIPYVAVEDSMETDHDKAASILRGNKSYTHRMSNEERIIQVDRNLARIKELRNAWLIRNGFTEHIAVNGGWSGQHISHAKSVQSIKPDLNLQAHLECLGI